MQTSLVQHASWLPASLFTSLSSTNPTIKSQLKRLSKRKARS